MLGAVPAHAATSVISGVVLNADSTPCAFCTIQFNPLIVQQGNIAPKIVSTTTDASGNLIPITLTQGLAVQITISENYVTFAPYTAIVPFSSTATFTQMNQGIITQSLNSLASLSPATGPVTFNGQQLINLGCPTGAGNGLAWGCNASIANLTVTGSLTASGAALNVTSGLNVNGLLTVTGISNPSAPVVTSIGTTGSTTYGYFVVCHDGNGGVTLPSSAGTTTNGNATLSGTNYNSVAFTIPTHATNCDILRGSTSVSATGGLGVTVSPFLDQSNATSAYVAPTFNTTGNQQITGNYTGTGETLTGPLTVGGTATLNGPTNITNTLTDSGGTASFGAISTSGIATLATGSVTGNFVVGGTLSLDGPLSFVGGSSGSAAIQVAAVAGNPNPIQLPTTTGAAGSFLQTDGGSPQQTSWTPIAHGMQLFTSGGTFTVPGGVTNFVVKCWGPGGGGGGYGSANTSGGDGSASTTVISGASVTVCSASLGHGGAGAAASAVGDGGAGSTLSGTGTVSQNGSKGFPGSVNWFSSGSVQQGGSPGVSAQSVAASFGSGGVGGGDGAGHGGGGGGGGQFDEANVTTTPASTYAITIATGGTAGTGGAQNGISGQNGAVLFTW